MTSFLLNLQADLARTPFQNVTQAPKLNFLTLNHLSTERLTHHKKSKLCRSPTSQPSADRAAGSHPPLGTASLAYLSPSDSSAPRGGRRRKSPRQTRPRFNRSVWPRGRDATGPGSAAYAELSMMRPAEWVRRAGTAGLPKSQ
jgi:hypothetical protein